MGDDGRVRRWIRIFKPDPRSEVTEELEFHIEQRVRDNIARGLDPQAAREAATTRFGNVDVVREECADLLSAERRIEARRVFLNVSWLDFKLGFRMLAKYPGLTLIGGLGMATAIAIGSGYTVFLDALQDTTLPLPQGDRVVALQNWDLQVNNKNPRSFHDFVTWRKELRSVQDVSAYRTISRNLVAADGSAEPLLIAEMSPAGFRVAGVQPLMGRHLLENDERAGAPPVVVIGYDVWQRRFNSDARILGRELRFGSTIHTVVGVMPKDFAFPVNHQIWIPFRVDPAEYKRGEGPSITVFGRLAPGVTLAQARAEIKVIGQRTSSAFPDTHKLLRAQVQPFTYAFSGMDNPGDRAGARVVRVLLILLLVVICVNVAALVYARTAVRSGEILVRTALGASRRRVIAQLFAEALVLALLAAAFGLGIVVLALHQVRAFLGIFFGGQMPFWFELRLSWSSMLYAVLLAVIAAVITGVLPALKATGRQLQTSLQQLSSGGSELLLGRTWTLLIIGQVTFTVALLPAAVYQGTELMRYGTADPGFDAGEYLSSTVYMERGSDEQTLPSAAANQAAEFSALYNDRISELIRRLRSEAGVVDVTYAWSDPGSEPSTEIELESRATPQEPGDSVAAVPTTHTVRLGRVDVGFFKAFDIPIVAGRTFTAADANPGAMAVIVNQSFVQRIHAEGTVLGLRIRQAGELYRPARFGGHNKEGIDERWLEVVGVIPDFPTTMIPEQVEAKVYRAALPGDIYPARIALRMRGVDPASVSAQLRKVTSALDPALQVEGVNTLRTIYDRNQSALRLTGLGIAIVTLSVLLLSAAGIYAMMSLAVARRRREIGIRAALGANPRRILVSIFTRAALQLGVGIAAGLAAFLGVWKVAGGNATDMLLLLALVSVIMLTVGLLALMGPARRGLRIQPTEALRHE